MTSDDGGERGVHSAERRQWMQSFSSWTIGLMALVTLLGVFLLATAPLQAEKPGKASKKAMLKKLQALAPARGYLQAHKGVTKPFDLLGGPIKVNIKQEGGGVFVALPDYRRLDPNVFGTPKLPRAFGGTPGINGVPPLLRASRSGGYTKMTALSPFGDKYLVMGGASLRIAAVDATATDAARSNDSVALQASWMDKAGNTYAVKCCKKLAVHGLEFPTFGGVVTNTILHGFSRIGTALMPSEFTYFAFWGMGEVRKNGKVLDAPRLIHGMLTEYVRTTGYRLGFDADVTPTRRHFHLMVPPMMPNPKEGHFQQKSVNTGLTLPNGKTLPFWHVMFENLDVRAERG